MYLCGNILPGTEMTGWNTISTLSMTQDIITHYLLTHRRHVFSSYLAPLGLADEQADGFVLPENQHKGIAYATCLDSCTRHVPIHVFDDLSLGTICSSRIKRHKCIQTTRIHTRFEDAYSVRHHMQDSCTLKERSSTDRSPRYTSRNSQIRLSSPGRNLSHCHF